MNNNIIRNTLLKALNPRVYCACSNVLCNAQNCVVIPSIIALSRHFARLKEENLVKSFWLVSPVVSDP